MMGVIGLDCLFGYANHDSYFSFSFFDVPRNRIVFWKDYWAFFP